MDTVRLAMWFDLQLGPHYKAKNGKCALVWDNCGPHNVDAIKDIADEWRIFPMALPPNMTDVLQVMDLVVNAPVKAAVRRDRANELFNYAQAFKIEWLKATVDRTLQRPQFKPPKPTVAGGIRSLLRVCETTFSTDRFVKSLKDCFVDVGLAPFDRTETESTYRLYKDHKHGSLNPRLFGYAAQGADSLTLGELVQHEDNVHMCTRNDDMLDSDDDDSDDNDSDVEGDE